MGGKKMMDYVVSDQVYVCRMCETDLAPASDLESKAFRGRTGKAYLFTNACNCTHGPLEERNMITGVHQVMDVYCKGCDGILGWKYEKAYDKDQAYKVGKFCLEKARIEKKTLALLSNTPSGFVGKLPDNSFNRSPSTDLSSSSSTCNSSTDGQ